MKDNDSSINSVCDWLRLIVSNSLVLHLGKGKHFDDLPFDAGHLIGNLFGGSGDAENLSPQNWVQNRYGTFRMQERRWQGQLLIGEQVWAKVIDKYHQGEDQPYVREVKSRSTIQGQETITNKLTFGNFQTARSRTARAIAPSAATPQFNNLISVFFQKRQRI